MDISRLGLTIFYIEKGDKAAAEREINKIRDTALRGEAEQRYNVRFGGMAQEGGDVSTEERSIPGIFFQDIQDILSSFSSGGTWDILGRVFWYIIIIFGVLCYVFYMIEKRTPSDKTVHKERDMPEGSGSFSAAPQNQPGIIQKNTPASQICNWATACHLTALTAYVGIPLGGILGPLLTWLFKRHDAAFIDEHGKESLNFHITITLYEVVAILLCFIFIGFPLIFVLIVIDLINTIKGAIAASNGQPYKYPMSVRFFK